MEQELRELISRARAPQPTKAAWFDTYGPPIDISFLTDAQKSNPDQHNEEEKGGEEKREEEDIDPSPPHTKYQLRVCLYHATLTKDQGVAPLRSRL
jgi:hypothetical protein